MKQNDNDLNILFEDNHLLIVEKPPGLPTQPSKEHSDSLETRLKAYIKETYKKPGEVFLHAIHRLDRCTSGLVLFAKTSKALKRLQEMQKLRKIEKKYLAVIPRGLYPKQGKLSHFLLHSNFKASIVPPSTQGAKKAELLYEITKENEEVSLLLITLLTGRYHQIRAQLSHLGFPIIGDAKYKSNRPFQKNSIALHSCQLSFIHPVTKKEIALYCPLTTFHL